MGGALPVRSVALAGDSPYALQLGIGVALQLGHQPLRYLAQRPWRAPVVDLGVEPVAGSPEARPVERLLGRRVARRVLDRPPDDRSRERGDRSGRLEIGLHVDLAE